MRWTVVVFVLLAAVHYATREVAEAQFFALGAIMFVLMEIADNTKAGRRNL